MLRKRTSGDLSNFIGPGSFLEDISVHPRFLMALPLLIFAESVCLPPGRVDEVACRVPDLKDDAGWRALVIADPSVAERLLETISAAQRRTLHLTFQR
jgi:hypothetical protein